MYYLLWLLNNSEVIVELFHVILTMCVILVIVIINIVIIYPYFILLINLLFAILSISENGQEIEKLAIFISLKLTMLLLLVPLQILVCTHHVFLLCLILKKMDIL